jgi:hypothetical protein
MMAYCPTLRFLLSVGHWDPSSFLPALALSIAAWQYLDLRRFGSSRLLNLQVGIPRIDEDFSINKEFAVLPFGGRLACRSAASGPLTGFIFLRATSPNR